MLTRLRASSALSSFVSDRIYDVPPGQPHERTSPYIHMGPWSSTLLQAECFESYDINGQIDIYSWGQGEAASTMQASKISRLVADVAEEMGLDTIILGDSHELKDFRLRSKRILTASDGKTKHIPMSISAIVDKR